MDIMDLFDNPAFDRAAAHLAELEVNSTSWANIVVAAEAMERRLTVRRSKARPRMVICLLYTSPSPRDLSKSRMPSSA